MKSSLSDFTPDKDLRTLIQGDFFVMMGGGSVLQRQYQYAL